MVWAQFITPITNVLNLSCGSNEPGQLAQREHATGRENTKPSLLL